MKREMKIIKDFAKKGEQHDIMDALTLLTHAYISQCGISLGVRTIVYCAAESWQEKLAWLDLPLSEMARKEPLGCMMPYITKEYDRNKYDYYDIEGMDKEELLSGCWQIIQERAFDKNTIEVLCWGVMKAVEVFDEPLLLKEIEATATDGIPLKGVLMEQKCGHTWVEMTFPYDKVGIAKNELARDVKALLIAGYDDYLRLHNMESEIRALYPKYQEELQKRKNQSLYKKELTFDDVYGKLIGNTVLIFPNRLFNDWFGLEIFEIK